MVSLLLAARAERVIWVDPRDGSDANDGTRAAPLRTLYAARDAAEQTNSAVIELAAGAHKQLGQLVEAEAFVEPLGRRHLGGSVAVGGVRRRPLDDTRVHASEQRRRREGADDQRELSSVAGAAVASLSEAEQRGRRRSAHPTRRRRAPRRRPIAQDRRAVGGEA